jgi:hypothetical protein
MLTIQVILFGDSLKKVGMDGKCSIHGEMKTEYKFFNWEASR